MLSRSRLWTCKCLLPDGALHAELSQHPVICVCYCSDHVSTMLAQASQGVDPGTHVTVKSTSEVVHVTLAYAAATTALTSFLEWKDLASGAGGDAYKRQLAAADASSVHTVVDNRLGVAAQMQLDFGDRL